MIKISLRLNKIFDTATSKWRILTLAIAGQNLDNLLLKLCFATLRQAQRTLNDTDESPYDFSVDMRCATNNLP